MTNTNSDKSEDAATLKPAQALIVVPVVFILCGLFIGLNLLAGSSELYTGFFFALYWAGIQRHRFEVFPATVGGAFFGLLLALILNLLSKHFGAVGAMSFLALIAPIVFCQLVGYCRLFISNATMIFLVVGTIPYVQSHADFKGMFVSLALGVAFLGGLIWALNQFARWRGSARPNPVSIA